MMQHLTRSELFLTQSAVRKYCNKLRDDAHDSRNNNATRAQAEYLLEGFGRIYDTLQAILDDPKAQRIAID